MGAAPLPTAPQTHRTSPVQSLHVVNQTLAAADLEDSEELETLGGKSLKVRWVVG